MRASIILLILTLTSPLFFGQAAALQVMPDELTMRVRQGQTALFHIQGGMNETVKIHMSHVGPQGQAVTVIMGEVQLDEEGKADLPVAMTGELAAIGVWEILVTNGTVVAKARYEVDWDPAYLLLLEGQNLARQAAFWGDVKYFVVWVVTGLVVFWSALRLWHEWSHQRPTHIWQRLKSRFGVLGNIASVSDMGAKFASNNPNLVNRAMYHKSKAVRLRHEKVLAEELERVDARIRERDEAMKMEKMYRERVLSENPDDPLVQEMDGEERLKDIVEAELGMMGYRRKG